MWIPPPLPPLSVLACVPCRVPAYPPPSAPGHAHAPYSERGGQWPNRVQPPPPMAYMSTAASWDRSQQRSAVARMHAREDGVEEPLWLRNASTPPQLAAE